MNSALQPAQAAIYTALTGDSTLMALFDGANDGVFDAIAEATAARKYVLVGEAFETNDNTFTENLVDQSATIHVCVEDTDKQRGNKTAQTIANRVIQVLHGAALTVAGYTTVTCEYDTAQTLPPDGSWRHVVIEFQLILQES